MFNAQIVRLNVSYRRGRRLSITYDVCSKDGRIRQRVRGHFGKDIPIAFDGDAHVYNPAADAEERLDAAQAILHWLKENAWRFDREDHLPELCRLQLFCTEVVRRRGFINYPGRYESIDD